ncbi:MAG: zinc ribbon domain-containing protein [Huintestinicola sp.]
MSKCIQCGATLNENSKFCPECGTPVALSKENIEIKSETIDMENDSASLDKYSSDRVILKTADEIVFPDIPSDIPTESMAEELEAAAKNILDDIPTVKTVDERIVPMEGNKPIEEQTESSTEAAAEEKADKHDESEITDQKSEPVEKNAPDDSKNAEIPAEKEKKRSGKAVLICIIVVIVLAAGAFGISFLKIGGPKSEGTVTTEVIVLGASDEAASEEDDTSVSATTVAETTVSEAEPEMSDEISTSVSETAEETIEESVISVSEETAAESDMSETEPETEALVFEHRQVVGKSVCVTYQTALLNPDNLDLTTLNSESLFVVEYQIAAELALGKNPLVLIVNYGSGSVELAPSSAVENLCVFEYSAVCDAVTSAGGTPEEITELSLRGDGVAVDVTGITVTR